MNFWIPQNQPMEVQYQYFHIFKVFYSVLTESAMVKIVLNLSSCTQQQQCNPPTHYSVSKPGQKCHWYRLKNIYPLHLLIVIHRSVQMLMLWFLTVLFFWNLTCASSYSCKLENFCLLFPDHNQLVNYSVTSVGSALVKTKTNRKTSWNFVVRCKCVKCISLNGSHGPFVRISMR